MKKSIRQPIWLDIAAAIILLLFAFGLTSFIRQVGVQKDDASLLNEYEALRLNLEAMEERYDALVQANANLIEKRDGLLDLLGNPDKNPDLVKAWQETALLAGMTDLNGPGLIVYLEDKVNYNPLVDPVEALVHDKTLLHVLALLTDYGATAMSVNEIRLTAVPQIYCIGPTILCNVHRLAPPYEIHVIGDADSLASILTDDAWLQRLTSPQIGVRLRIEPSDAVYVPSFAARGDYLNHITLLEVQ